MNTTPSEAASTPSGLRARLSRRTTTGRNFIPEIDGMRLIAIGMVVLVHISSFTGAAYRAAPVSMTLGRSPQSFWIWHLAYGGKYGVQLFFVISGFILALPFAAHLLQGGRKVDLGRYYLRRLTRLEPPYIIALTLAVVLLIFVEGQSLSALLPHYVAGLFYLHGTIYGAEDPVNILTWSLEVEIQFYILVPLLVSVFRIPDARVRRAVLVGASLIAMALQHTVFASNARVGLSILGFIQFFLMGFLLADVYLLDWKSSPSRSLRWDAVWVVAWVAMIGVLQFSPGQWAFPFLAFIVFLAAFRGTWTSRVLRTPWIYTIGGMCYSIYLIHQLVINMAHHVTMQIVPSRNFVLDLGVQLVLLVPAVLVASALFFVWVERPFMNPRWPQDLSVRIRRRDV